MKKLNILILCGGQSGEHEVSLQSAYSIFQNIDRNQYEPILVGIKKDGTWCFDQELILDTDKPDQIHLNPAANEVHLINGKLDGKTMDCVFPVLHGTFGEDGCMQGFLELQHLPYVGPGVAGSAIGMDKDIMKKMLKDAQLLSAKSVTLRKHQPMAEYKQISDQLGEVVFVKPCNLGSSVGVSKCRNKEEFEKAVQEAFSYDTKVIVEEFIQGREIELAVLGNYDLQVSIAGEVIPLADFYSYDAKYLDSEGAKLQIPAELKEVDLKRLQETALQAFQAMECQGLGRVDVFLTESGKIYINEINTLPGFTKISMYPKLWQESGLSYPDLIGKLIQLAIERQEEKEQLNRNFF